MTNKESLNFNCFNKSVLSLIDNEEFPFGKTEMKVLPCIISDKINLKKICIIQLTALGDIVQTLPVVEFYKKNTPEIEVTFITFKNFAGILMNHYHICKLITIDSDFIIDNFKNDIQLKFDYLQIQIKELNSQNFDALINLHPSKFSAYLTSLINSRAKIGLQFDGSFENTFISGDLNMYFRYFPSYIISKSVFDENNLIDYFLKSAQCGSAERRIILGNTPRRVEIIKKIKKDDKKIIGICFGAVIQIKKYSPQYFNKLIQILNSKGKFNFILFGAKPDLADSEIISANNLNIINLTGKLELSELPDYISCCDYFITIDSGLMHIASAYNSKIFVLLGPTNTKPVVSPSVAIFSGTCEFQPCFKTTCESNSCMHDLFPEKVADIFLKFVDNSLELADSELTIESSVENLSSHFYSMSRLNKKISDLNICRAEAMNLFINECFFEINGMLYYKNNFTTFSHIFLNSKQHLNSPEFNNEVHEILCRKFNYNIVKQSIKSVTTEFTAQSENVFILLNKAVKISEIIYEAILNNQNNVLSNINDYLTQLDKIDCRLNQNEYNKKFFNLLTAVFYSANVHDDDFQLIAENTLNGYRIKFKAYKILLNLMGSLG